MNLLEILSKPHSTLESIARGQRLWSAVAVVIIWASVNSVLTLVLFLNADLQAQFPRLSPASLDGLETVLRVLAPVSAFLVPLAWWIVISALMLLTTGLFGGRTSFPAMLAVVGAACAPWAIGYLIQLPLGIFQLLLPGRGTVQAILGFLALLVSAVSLCWHGALVVIGAKLAAGTSYRGAGASCALTGLGCATVGFILVVTVLTLIFVLSGAA